MTDSKQKVVIDETIAPGMRYKEETGYEDHTLSARYCGLWPEGGDKSISSIDLISFRKRFGAVTVDAEGLGGVETLPEHRQKGYVRQVIDKAMEGMAERVSVAFIPEAIESLYVKFGFETCLPDGRLTIWVRQVEHHLGHLLRADSPYTLRAFTADDLPAMIDLYNTVHATRPWTFERQANWNRIRPQQTWRAGSEVIILTEGDRLVGYAILPRYTYGQVSRQYVVDELTAENRTVAQHLLAEISARCHQFYLSEFQIREPLDSMVGTVAQAIGCFYRQEFFSAGGILGLILNRQKLLDELEPELRRRLGSGDQTDHAQAFAKLQQGDLIPDDTTLLRLLLGTWSLVEAEVNGTVIPPTYQRICQGWFPGGGTYFLPTPYSHYLDRY